MNTRSNSVSEPARDLNMNDSRVITPAAISAIQRLYWSVRRELWEYRSIYIAPWPPPHCFWSAS